MTHQPIETQVIIAVTIGGMVILNAAILWFMPRLTRPEEARALSLGSFYRCSSHHATASLHRQGPSKVVPEAGVEPALGVSRTGF